MTAYLCTACGYLYDDETAEKNKEDRPIPFEELDETWQCPNCGVRANEFEPVDSDRTPDAPAS
jgi:rubredoxin